MECRKKGANPDTEPPLSTKRAFIEVIRNGTLHSTSSDAPTVCVSRGKWLYFIRYTGASCHIYAECFIEYYGRVCFSGDPINGGWENLKVDPRG